MGHFAGRTVLAVALGAAFAATAAAQPTNDAKSTKPRDAVRERGRYVVTIGGCNDCHTPNYAMSGGKVDESQWLIGDSFGWRGPWGTTYPVNLRLYMQGMTENQWVAKAKQFQTRPPMPWFNVNKMSESDLRAVYRYIRSLTPVGDPAPAYVPPTQEPKPPFATFPAPPK